MTIAIVIGNGPSRLQVDLNKLKSIATTYGCNAIYRDFTPHYLISMDRYMVDEILKSRAHHDSVFYTQHDNRVDEIERSGEPINFVRTNKSTSDSGTAAVQVAISHGNDVIYVIGFDYSNGDAKLPNVYAGTPNYLTNHASAHMQDEKYKQRLRKLIKDNPDTKFVRVNGSNNNLNLEADNFSEITIEQFKEHTNANKL